MRETYRYKNYKIFSRASRSLIITLLILSGMANAQVDTTYAFIVAGHAYGAHSGGNLGLHPVLLNSLDAGIDTNAAFFFFHRRHSQPEYH